MANRVGIAQFYQAINTASNFTAYPTVVTDGVEVPGGKKAEAAHLVIDSNAGCSVMVIGMTDSKVAPGLTTIGNRWVELQDYSRPGDQARPWAEPLDSITAYKRITVRRTDQNANCTMNAYIGFGEQQYGR